MYLAINKLMKMKAKHLINITKEIVKTKIWTFLRKENAVGIVENLAPNGDAAIFSSSGRQIVTLETMQVSDHLAI